MSILLVNASTSRHSRTAALLHVLRCKLDGMGWSGAVQQLRIVDLPAARLLAGGWGDAEIERALYAVAQSTAVVFATPIYQAAYSGALKIFLDVLPHNGLQGKTVLPLATGGSAHHMLALDYALRPVLQALAARHVLPGVYALAAHISLPDDVQEDVPTPLPTLQDDLDARLHAGATVLLAELQRQAAAPLRCSA